MMNGNLPGGQAKTREMSDSTAESGGDTDGE